MRIRSFLFTVAWLSQAALAHATLSDDEASAAAQQRSPAPQRLVITVVTTEPALPTFEQRVSSWFVDGTQVSVRLASEVTPELLLATSSGEIRVCVVPRGAKRVLVTFATLQTDASRHLLRDVHLRDGLDEIGLERVASVIHSASLALREGVEGSVRQEAERDLVEAGLLEAPPASALAPLAAPSAAPPAAPPAASPALSEPAIAPHEAPGTAWLLGAEYGVQARGAEGLGHGPGALVGLQVPSAAGAIDVLLRARVLLRSAFEAGPLDVSLQTTALRANFGVEPGLGHDVFLQALLGGGVDVAHIRPQHRQDVTDAELGVVASRAGTQYRGAGELALGITKRTPRVDFGLMLHCSFLLGDVHYTLTRNSGDERLVTPWAVQPALSLQARFRGPL